MPKGFLQTALALLAALGGGAALADDTKLVTRSYPVADFVVSYQPALVPPPPVMMVHAPQGARLAAPWKAPVPAVPTEVRGSVEALSRLMVNMVKPYSWKAMGGAGTVTFDPANNSLVVTQTADVHAHVADLIASMRRIQSASMPQVVLQLTVVEVPAAFLERTETVTHIKAVCGTTAPCCGSGEECPVLEALRADGKQAIALTDEQVKCLTECIQGDKRSSLLCRPMLVATDMQTCQFEAGQETRYMAALELIAGPNGVERKPRYVTVPHGTSISAQPKVSADRNSVELRLTYRSAQPVLRTAAVAVKVGESAEAEMVSAAVTDVQEFATTLAMRTGTTMLLAGPVTTRQTKDASPEKYRQLLLVKATVMTPGCDVMQMGQMVGATVTTNTVTPSGIVTTTKAATPTCAATGCKVACTASDCKACPTECETVAVAKPARPVEATDVARLVSAYRQACTEGRTEDAIRLAMQALSRDPNCFAEPK